MNTTRKVATDQQALETLQRLEEELTNRLEKLSADMSKSHSADSGEQAVERENDEVVEQLQHDTGEELRQVGQAIKRIEAGTYHQCQQCGGEIAEARLQVLPYVSICIACAELAG
ncbi:MAG: Dimethylmenaquinone methyltransferase [uncultured Thiotrichaceae bacterium]|uniref:Dimethylmenaquinone methyltransferase n=1 Tax=uncultured Thiotrichaceae bacterium TaxID=298394 RepID=A0A6S6T9W3_9GAMM|nr:MAG: Dimethylmenaquinone methyltransferase [uncultured Thiotrichaceae bacterium]